MPAQIIPIAEGGHGAYTWDRSRAAPDTYYIRRGSGLAVRLTIAHDIPFHAEILERICHAFNDQESEGA